MGKRRGKKSSIIQEPPVGVIIAPAGGGGATFADQTIVFGAATLAGGTNSGGKCPLITTGAAIQSSGSQINSGNTGSKFTLSVSGGVAYLALASSTASGPYTLNITLTNVNSVAVTANVTVNTEANTYSVATDADITNIFALGAATLSGKTCKLRTGTATYGRIDFSRLACSSDFTMTKHTGASPVVCNITIFNCQHIYISNLEVFTDTYTAGGMSGGYQGLIEIVEYDSTSCDNITIDGCTIHAKHSDPAVGTHSNQIRGIQASSTPLGVKNLTIKNCSIYDTAQTIYLFANNAATITIDDNTLYHFGDDCIQLVPSDPKNPFDLNMRRNTMYDGIYDGTGGGHVDFCQYLSNGYIQMTTTTTGTGTVTLSHLNLYTDFGDEVADGASVDYVIYDSGNAGWEKGVGTYHSAGPTLSRDTVSASSNSGSKISLGSTGVRYVLRYYTSGVTDMVVDIRKNVLVQTSATFGIAANDGAGVVQGIFGIRNVPGSFVTGTIEENFCCVGAPAAISIEGSKNLTINKNTVVRNHANAAPEYQSNRNISNGFLPFSDVSGTGIVNMNNVAEATYKNGVLENDNDSNHNVQLGTEGATHTYASQFVGIAGNFIPATVADAITMFQPKSGGLLYGNGIGAFPYA